MPRQNKPWYWKARGEWCVKINGVRHRLGPDEDKAIRKFHELQKPEASWSAETRPGLHAGDRTTPIASVACYIPRGKGSFPSSVLMTCIPASVAGVADICIVTPPGPDGRIDAASLVAAINAAGSNS